MLRAARIALLALAASLLVGCAAARYEAGLLPLPGLPPGLSSTIYGRRPMVLLRIHEGIWEDVRTCLARLDVAAATDAPAAWAVRWSLADSIRIDDGYWAYGLTVWRATGPPEVIIEVAWWLNPGIVSHEAIHVMTQDSTHVGAPWMCEMPSYDLLPLRPAAPLAAREARR